MSQQGSSLAFDDCSRTQQPSCVSGFLVQTQNSPQTLEDAFSRLSVSASPFNRPHFDFISDDPLVITDPSKVLSCNDWGRGVLTPQSSNFWHPTFTPNTGYTYYDRFLNSENPTFGGAFSSLPLSYGTQQKTPDADADTDFLNGFLGGNGSDILGFNAEESRLRWFNDLRGRVLLLAKDQHECRTLQESMKMFTNEEFCVIFLELINHVNELMVDPFGNYVVQRMVEICSEEQRTRIVFSVTHYDFQLVRICLSPHGTRAVEKLMEHITTQEQRVRVMSSLSPGAAILAKDVNGHRVILHCLKYFSAEENKHLLNVVANKCFWIATDKTGCCVLQQCVNHAQGGTKKNLIAAIIVNASVLAEDCYGNYVVQHLLSLRIPGVAERLLRQLEGKFFYLACNKYGSNVVERFFQDSGEPYSTIIILELLYNFNVAMLLVDPYGNYVIKSALSVSKGGIRNALEQLIKLNSLMMQSNLYGKKLLSWFDKRKI
ncbi:Pumilio-like 12, partial [Mucuna pruriens]